MDMILKLSDEEKAKIDRIADQLKIETHLDPIIRAVVNYLYKQDQNLIEDAKKKKKEIKNMSQHQKNKLF